jgi:hypothetical protein
MRAPNSALPGSETAAGAGFKSKLPRRALGRGVLTLLILLRIYVVLAVPIVAYAFIRALGVL